VKTFLSDKEVLKEYFEQGCKILSYVQTNYKKIFPTDDIKLFGIEYKLLREIRPGIECEGYIDIITTNEKTGTFVIYDLKTSKKGWTPEQKTDILRVGQLLLYKKLLAEQLGIDPNKISVEFIILKRTVFEQSMYTIPRVSKFEPPNKQPSIRKLWERFERFLDSCFDAEGNHITEQYATPNKSACRFCEFRKKKDLCSVSVTK
jgi:hypothetical protein